MDDTAKPEFEPILTPRFHFKFRGQMLAIVDMQLMPDTSAVTMPMEVCDCGREECRGYNQLRVSPMEALAYMGQAINLLIDERDAHQAQQEPGAN